MNDTRTEQEKYEAWLRAVNLCARTGWQCVSGWVFRAPSGTRHADLMSGLGLWHDLPDCDHLPNTP